MNYAYARVSAKDQNLQRQIAAFCEFGIDKSRIFFEKKKVSMSAVNFAVRRTSASNLRDVKDMNEYNNLQMRPLNRLSPNEYLASFFLSKV